MPPIDDVDHLLCSRAHHLPRHPAGAGGAAGRASGGAAGAHRQLPAAESAGGADEAERPGAPALPTVMSLLLPWEAVAHALPGALAGMQVPSDLSVEHSYAQVACIVTNVTHFVPPATHAPGVELSAGR